MRRRHLRSTSFPYTTLFRSAPEFERMLVRDGIELRKYWFSISDAEQEKRFQQRAQDPLRRWKLSPMDIESRARWVDYSRAKDRSEEHTSELQSRLHLVCRLL